jgi:hypothetical protein
VGPPMFHWERSERDERRLAAALILLNHPHHGRTYVGSGRCLLACSHDFDCLSPAAAVHQSYPSLPTDRVFDARNRVGGLFGRRHGKNLPNVRVTEFKPHLNKRSPCRFQTFACRRTENHSPAGRSCFTVQSSNASAKRQHYVDISEHWLLQATIDLHHGTRSTGLCTACQCIHHRQ